jgi:hypothetical protein
LQGVEVARGKTLLVISMNLDERWKNLHACEQSVKKRRTRKNQGEMQKKPCEAVV